jgi:peptidoglycan/LPS O-acetylase OafA/YrhL
MHSPHPTPTYQSLRISRGLAALGVVLFHAAVALGSPEAFTPSPIE